MRVPLTRGFAVAFLAFSTVIAQLFVQRAFSDDCGWDVTGCGGDRNGVFVTLSQRQMQSLPLSNGKVVGQPGFVGFEYDYRSSCGGSPAGGDSLDCPKSMRACLVGDGGPGPLTVVWRREVYAAPREPSGWVRLGTTCFPESGPMARRLLTLAMVEAAFHRTPWARVGLGVQPPGGVTLVRFDTYFAVVWGSAGFEPGEVDVVDPGLMLGNRVEIRPRLVSVTYVFGDGSVWGPTLDVGGVFPSGSVRHRYQRVGSVVARVDVVMGADFRVNGSGWAPVPGSVTLVGVPTLLTVRSARAQLVR